MKKLLIVLFLFLFSMPAFAGDRASRPNSPIEHIKITDDIQVEHIPIPTDKQLQYKTEIEQYIDIRVPIAKKRMENELKASRYLYKQFSKEKYKYINKEEYLYNLEDILQNIKVIHFNTYFELINITNKYVNTKNILPTTDMAFDLDLFMIPYLENNQIKNRNKLNDLYSFYFNLENEIHKIDENISNY